MVLPLLKLPYSAIIKVVKIVDVLDILILAQTSSNIQNLIKTNKIPIELNVTPGSITFNKVEAPEKSMELNVHRKTELTGFLWKSIKNHDTYYKSHWQIQSEGYKNTIDYFVKNFKIQQISFKMGNSDDEPFLQTIEHVKHRGLKFGKVSKEMIRDSPEALKRVFAACSNATELDLSMSRSRAFLRFEKFYKFSMDSFRLSQSYDYIKFITSDNLCDLINCSNIYFKYVCFKENDLRTFLKYWMKKSSRLKSMRFRLDKPPHLSKLLSGIEKTTISKDKVYQIQRADGVKAIVRCEDEDFSLEVRSE